MKILFINTQQPRCGIHQFGKRVFNAIALSKTLDVVYAQPYSWKNLVELNEQHIPDVTIYSSNATTIPFLYTNNIKSLRGVHVGLSHEPEQCLLDRVQDIPDYFNSSTFQFWLGFDPTLDVSKNSNCFNITRPITRYNPTETPEVFTIGHQCFGLDNRNQASIVRLVCKQFNKAAIQLHLPSAYYGDDSSKSTALRIAQECRESLTNPNISLNIDTDWFDNEEDLLHFVSKNTVNMYCYFQYPVPSMYRGVASGPDASISTRRTPIVNDCSLYRHIAPYYGTIKSSSIIDIYNNDIKNKITEQLYNEWTPERTLYDIENMIEKVVK